MNAEQIRVELGARSYDVVIGPGLLADAGGHLAQQVQSRTLAIVTDANVADLHLSAFRTSLQSTGIRTTEVVVPAGEHSKSFGVLQTVVDALLEARLERGDCVVALGGGVVGDLAGFAAAIARRGMPFIQVPTTLLAQVDSSVGGKTGINSRFGKNLIGAFHQPLLVLADTNVLDTLPQREFAAGYAELAKCALLGDEVFFRWLEEKREAIFAGREERVRAIADAVRAKARIVAADEQETGERALLNLGHTFGHALEAACGFDNRRLIHGEAVAIGTVLAHDFSVAEGHAPAADAERVRTHFRAVGLPTAVGEIAGPALSVGELMTHIGQDKKVSQGRLTFILTRGIGQAFIARDVPAERVAAFLAAQVPVADRQKRA